MFRLYYLAVDMVAPVLLLPLGFFLYGSWIKYPAQKTWIYLLFALYLAGVYHMTGLPDVLYYRKDITLYFGLLVGILEDIPNSILNVLLFLPLGVFLRLLCDRYSDWRASAGFGFGMSLVIELMQMYTLRTTDVNDLLTNTLGAVLGTFAARALLRRWPSLALHGPAREIAIPLSAAFLVMFFIQPFFFRMLW